MTLPFILCSILGLVSAWFLIAPHLKASDYNAPEKEDARRQSLLEEKERLIQIIRDLELDHATHKISDEEFEVMNSRLRFDLVETLKQLE